MRAADLYDVLAPLYQWVQVPLQGLAVTRAAERALEGGPASVLEVGAGPGQGLALLGGAGRQVVGVDLARRMVSLARGRLATTGEQAALTRATVLALPFRSRRFDAVVANALLDLLSEQEQPLALDELTRVLAPGGRLVLGVMTLPNYFVKQAWMTAYRIRPELVGCCRPIELDVHLRTRPLRVLRDETVSGLIGVRVVTLVKSVG
jgi:ubiquinone/menaquinone biosynthesis C-methylase UbiE